MGGIQGTHTHTRTHTHRRVHIHTHTHTERLVIACTRQEYPKKSFIVIKNQLEKEKKKSSIFGV